MQLLSKELILSDEFQNRSDLPAPSPSNFELKERILQFGTGAFLRGFADFFIDQANRDGLFDGRVVAVGSTGSGRTDLFNRQDGLYTLVSQGKKDGRVVDDARVVSSISRTLSATDQWDAVLECAVNPDLIAILSNTTEIGIVLDEDDRPDLGPPRSFPGKLAVVLLERARAFEFDRNYAPVILPCELLEDNGYVLQKIIAKLAERWHFGAPFQEWLLACRFCNTLVDRIVPGMPDETKRESLFDRVGYHDDLLTNAEPYRLWAIEGDEALVDRLPFLRADDGIVVAEDITPYRELKVRILNGTHTIMVPAALQMGLTTVREAINDTVIGRFMRQAMLEEIVPSLDVDPETARPFAAAVLDRFDNPFIEHPLRSIMLQATMKCRVRILPSIRSYLEKHGRVPGALINGFALLLLIRRMDSPSDYPPDDFADVIRRAWHDMETEDEADVSAFVKRVLSDEYLWQIDVAGLRGVEQAVCESLLSIFRQGVSAHLDAFVNAPDVK